MSSFTIAAVLLLMPFSSAAQAPAADLGQSYQDPDTRKLVALVEDAAEAVRTRGEALSTISVSRAADGGRASTTSSCWIEAGTWWPIPIRSSRARTRSSSRM
jgi:hypothetical protein